MHNDKSVPVMIFISTHFNISGNIEQVSFHTCFDYFNKFRFSSMLKHDRYFG